MPPALALARDLLASSIRERIFPAAVAEVGSSSGTLWREAFGTLTFDDLTDCDEHTLFDLASLTKPLATTFAIIEQIGRGTVAFDERVASVFPDWRGADRDPATVQDLLEHCAGLAPRLIDQPPGSRREFEFEIGRMPLAYAPKATSVYTDLGFILLGFLAADAGSERLDRQFNRHVTLLRAADSLGTDARAQITFGPIASTPTAAIAPTRPLDEDIRRGELLTGEVHDNYAYALGGVAGHAGLFGNAAGVGLIARACLRALAGDGTLGAPFTPAQVTRTIVKSQVRGSSRALGWDTMLPTSSCGELMSSSAFGHVGYTGVSLWIDPTRDRYFVLLSNRVCDGGTSGQMQTVRRRFHDLVGDL